MKLVWASGSKMFSWRVKTVIKLCTRKPLAQQRDVLALGVTQWDLSAPDIGSNGLGRSLYQYWWALNYRKNSIIGCRVISRTSNVDLRNLNTVLSAAWKIKATQEKLSQITTNNKHFTVANVHPPFPPTIYTYGGKWRTSKLETFFLKLVTILHLSYSLDILI